MGSGTCRTTARSSLRRRAQRRLGQQQRAGRHPHRRHPQTGRGRSLHRQVARSSPTGSAMARACRSRSPVRVRMSSAPSGFTLVGSSAAAAEAPRRWRTTRRTGGRRDAPNLRRTHHARQVREEQRLHRHESARAGQQQRLAHLHVLPGMLGWAPVRWCAFDGSNGHDPSPKDPGQSMTWNPAEAWKFFTQF